MTRFCKLDGAFTATGTGKRGGSGLNCKLTGERLGLGAEKSRDTSTLSACRRQLPGHCPSQASRREC